MPRIVSYVPAQLGSSLAAVASSSRKASYDIAINGIPFNMKPSRELPYIRESAPFRKEQLDTASEAGEQSLSYWWTRSQLSFHGGAGLAYLDTQLEGNLENRIRFDKSRNVDVWTPGIVQRLPDSTLNGFSTADLMVSTQIGTSSVILLAAGGVLSAFTQATAASAGVTTTLTWGSTNPITELVTDGASYYVTTTTGVYKGPVDGSASGALIYNLPGGTSRVKLGWAKQRLMLGLDESLYELGVAGPALPAPVYTHPSVGWRWTCFSESPSSILIGGFLGSNSAIFRITTVDIDGTPILSGASSTATLPVGERVLTMNASVGSVLGIGTNRGVRVGSFDIYYGNLTYGPLTVETPFPVNSLTSRDRFLYAEYRQAIDGFTGLVRIDLGHPSDEEGRYAYASDLLPPVNQTGSVLGITVTTFGRIAYLIAGYGLLVSQGQPGSTGLAYLKTARIRYGTTEPKLFKLGSVQGDFIDGKVRVSIETDGQPLRRVFVWGPSLAQPPYFSLVGGALEWAALYFELIDRVQIRSYQVQALPGSRRQKLIQLPLMCYDSEVDRNGATIGYRGYAGERLKAVERLERSGDEVTLQAFADLGTQDRVVIDSVSYRQDWSPTNSAGVGGMLVVVVRTV